MRLRPAAELILYYLQPIVLLQEAACRRTGRFAARLQIGALLLQDDQLALERARSPLVFVALFAQRGALRFLFLGHSGWNGAMRVSEMHNPSTWQRLYLPSRFFFSSSVSICCWTGGGAAASCTGGFSCCCCCCCCAI